MWVELSLWVELVETTLKEHKLPGLVQYDNDQLECVCAALYIVKMHAHSDVIIVRHNQSESLGSYGDLPYQTECTKRAQPRVRVQSGKLGGTPNDCKHGLPSQNDHDAGAKEQL